LTGTLIWGPESQEGACESLKGPIALAIDVLFLFFYFLGVFSTIFSLFRKNNYVKFHKTCEFWLLIITHTYSGFIGPQILNFERSLSLSWCPKAVLYCLAKFLLEALLETLAVEL
jgi:hypothetical protein